jgi:formylglycine-generating enzyme required for sulfatase activity
MSQQEHAIPPKAERKSSSFGCGFWLILSLVLAALVGYTVYQTQKEIDKVFDAQPKAQRLFVLPPGPGGPVQAEVKPPRQADEEKDLITNSIGTKLKLVPAGSFLMGASSDDGDDASTIEKPRHKVTITKPFYLGMFEVTQNEYRQVMNENPSFFKKAEILPVESVSWYATVKFCNKLSEREGRKPYYKIVGETVTILSGKGYRLPTEAEWEYACRAGSTTKHPFGNNDGDLSAYAWFGESPLGETHLVGQKKANRWGFYDMQGNVQEWCQDLYSTDYYTFSPELDPPGPATAPKGVFRVFRGGSWRFNAEECRPANRQGVSPGHEFMFLGFRLAADQQ